MVGGAVPIDPGVEPGDVGSSSLEPSIRTATDTVNHRGPGTRLPGEYRPFHGRRSGRSRLDVDLPMLRRTRQSAKGHMVEPTAGRPPPGRTAQLPGPGFEPGYSCESRS